MARKRGKMALYEVMSKARARQDYAKTVEPLQTQKKPEKVQTPVSQVEPAHEEVAVPEPQVAVNWRKKPKILQYNLGRIEFSIPYQLAITAGLAIILLFLLIFRLGQYSSPKRAGNEPEVKPTSDNTGAERPALPSLASPLTTRTETDSPTPVLENRGAAPVSTGNNVIVLAQYNAPSQLQPAKEYFDKNGIPTEIVPVGSKYFLQTVERFVDNPVKAGTKGYELKQKITVLGKNYKAPQGYETFAPNYFSDAIGWKIEN